MYFISAFDFDFFVGSIKREIGHLCHDERRTKLPDKPASSQDDLSHDFAPGVSFILLILFEFFNRSGYPVTVYQGPPPQVASAWPMPMSNSNFLYHPEATGNELSVLSYVCSIVF